MEAKVYRAIYRLIMSIAHPPRRKREQFNDRWIVLVYIWAVLHERSVLWACQRCNWPKEMDCPLPSDTTMSRRLKTVGVVQLIERAMSSVSDLFGCPLVKQIDSKPLLVGAYSKDRDAKRGRIGAGQMARGYRLHVLAHGRIVRHWTLGTMNTHDSVMAPHLLRRLEGGGYAVMDNAYDSNTLHLEAAAMNHQLIAPAQRADRHVRDLKHNCSQRIRCLDLLASPLEFCGQPSRFAIALYNQRESIESCFGQLSMMGLNYLPAWIRGPRRVALWTAAKILIHTCLCALKQRLMT